MESLKRIQQLCAKYNVSSPEEVLVSIMAGRDPRNSPSDLIRRIDNIGDEPPDTEDWRALCRFIKDNYRHGYVPINLSLQAAKELHSGRGKKSNPEKNATAEEIESFRIRYDSFLNGEKK